jgi:hypothetical protein
VMSNNMAVEQNRIMGAKVNEDILRLNPNFSQVLPPPRLPPSLRR